MSAIKDEPAKRLAGKNINIAAASVEDTLTQGFTAEALQPLLAQITSQIGGDQQEMAMYANALLVIIESKLPPFNPDDESARVTAIRALLAAIAKGAKDTTAPYNPAT